MRFTSAQNKLILETDEKLRELERRALGDPEAKIAYRHELRRRAGLEHVEAIRCIGVYKTDDYGLDSHNMFYVASEELAVMATGMLNELDSFAYSKRSWEHRSAITELDNILFAPEDVEKEIMNYIGEQSDDREDR